MAIFKNASGVYFLRPIFIEFDDTGGEIAMFTIKDEDSVVNGKKYPSLRRLFVEREDPTEYLFAEEYLGGWVHWKKLIESSVLKGVISDWREELEIRVRAKALNSVKAKAQNPEDKESLQASKYLLSSSWKISTDPKVGRPSKEAIKREADKLFKEQSVYTEDYDRILGSSVN